MVLAFFGFLVDYSIVWGLGMKWIVDSGSVPGMTVGIAMKWMVDSGSGPGMTVGGGIMLLP